MAYVTLRDFSLALSDEIDNALMRFQILSPDSCILAGGKNADARKGKQWNKNPAGMLEQMGIARQAAQFEMEGEIGIEHIFRTVVRESPAHFPDSIFKRAGLGGPFCEEPRRKSLQGTAQLEDVQDVLLAEAHHPGAASSCLGNKPILRKQIDGLPNRSLGDTEPARPRAFDDAHAGSERSACDLAAQAVGHGVFYQGFGQIFSRSDQNDTLSCLTEY
jgi:hypothetical protein